jgi:hypothetical protein
VIFVQLVKEAIYNRKLLGRRIHPLVLRIANAVVIGKPHVIFVLYSLHGNCFNEEFCSIPDNNLAGGYMFQKSLIVAPASNPFASDKVPCLLASKILSPLSREKTLQPVKSRPLAPPLTLHHTFTFIHGNTSLKMACRCVT